MGFCGILFIMIIGAVIWSKISGSGSSGRNKNGYKYWVGCPHCHYHVGIQHDGLWNCPNCRNQFVYQNGKTDKSEDVVNPGAIPFIELLAKVAKADDVVTKEEIEYIDAMLKDAFNPNTRQLSEMRRIFNNAKTTTDGYRPLGILLRDNFQEATLEVKQDVLMCFLGVASVDNKSLRPKQDEIISYLAYVLGLTGMYEEMKAEFNNDTGFNNEFNNLEKYYNILGCTSQDSSESIKSNYRKLIKEYHPDKYMNKDLPQDFIDLANKKIKDIHEAYEAIMRYQKAKFENEVNDLKKYYEVLGCTSQDSFETIKSNYRKLIKEYHPDKYMNKDLPQDFIDLANQKIKDIHEAYEAITRYQKAN